MAGDLFAPLAALLATGNRTLEELGPPCQKPVLMEPDPLPTWSKDAHGFDTLRLQVVATDHFGNAALNLRGDMDGIAEAFFWCREHALGPLRRTYGEVPPDAPVVYVNSFGRVEVAINGGSAEEKLALGVGAVVIAKR